VRQVEFRDQRRAKLLDRAETRSSSPIRISTAVISLGRAVIDAVTGSANSPMNCFDPVDALPQVE
jgi:hypothetical protein